MPEYPEFESSSTFPKGATGGGARRDDSHIYADGSRPFEAEARPATPPADVDFDFKSLGDRAQSKGRELRRKVIDYSRENPDRALITALLSGYVAGKLVRLVFRGGRRARRYRQYKRLAREFA